jgi:hypothetical protein
MADSTTWKSIFCGSFNNTELDNMEKICLMQLTQQQGNLYSLAHKEILSSLAHLTPWKSVFCGSLRSLEVHLLRLTKEMYVTLLLTL